MNYYNIILLLTIVFIIFLLCLNIFLSTIYYYQNRYKNKIKPIESNNIISI
jgi:regulatory protein YycI of two-component signal transduction system YycFG